MQQQTDVETEVSLLTNRFGGFERSSSSFLQTDHRSAVSFFLKQTAFELTTPTTLI